jgi:hypothetical protein
MQLQNASGTLYVAPNDVVTTIQHIHVSNPGNVSVAFNMSLGVDNVLNRIYDLYDIGAGQALDVFCKYVMVGGDIIQAWATLPNALNLTINGQYAPAPVVPQLQPITDSPVGAWSLDGNADRSGNGLALSGGSNTYCGDLIKGGRANHNSIRGLAAANDAVLRITGEITVVARAWIGVLGSGFIAGMVKSQNVRECWSIVAGPSLSYLIESPTNISFSPVGAEFIVSEAWTFVAMRRTAAGVVTLNVNGAQATSAPLPVPTFSASNAFRIGGQVAGPSSGGFADVAVFAAFLTDAQIQARRRVMMGL